MSDDIVCVATARNATEAHQWRTVLEEAGIGCRVIDHLEAEFWKCQAPRAEVWAHSADLDRARSVLADHSGRARSDDLPFPPPRPEDERAAAVPVARRRGTDGDFRRPAARGK